MNQLVHVNPKNSAALQVVAMKSIDLAVRFLTGRSNILRCHEDHGKPAGQFIIKYSSRPWCYFTRGDFVKGLNDHWTSRYTLRP